MPSAPDYLTPPHVAEPRAGEACLVVAARERRGRMKSLHIIEAARSDWDAAAGLESGKLSPVH